MVLVRGEKTRYRILETSEREDLVRQGTEGGRGDKGVQNNESEQADAFLLCFSVSSRSSLLSTARSWVPALRASYPSTPIVLVGCKSDLRSSTCRASSPISFKQALATSKQCGAVLYVETSAKTSSRSTSSAFEVASMACQGHFSKQLSPICTSSPSSFSVKTFSKMTPRRDHSEPRLRCVNLNCLSPCITYPHPLSIRSRKSSLSSTSLCSKSSTLSSTHSDSSNICISTEKTSPRRKERNMKESSTVTIMCQRMNSHKEMEEVEIDVPANVYSNIESIDNGYQLVRNSKERRSLGSKLKKLILKG